MCEKISSLDKSILEIPDYEADEILNIIHKFRFTLRENFEKIADGNPIDREWVSFIS